MKKIIAILLIVLLMPMECFAQSYPDSNPDPNAPPERPHLTRSMGVFDGISGKETYYNLPMGKCISVMRDLGYDTDTYPFWIRGDGAKMLGEYVMCACDYDIRPRGTIIETSLGMAIVVDTGAFASGKVTTQIDLCTDW